MLRRLIENHVLGNLVTVLIIALGVMSYQLLPREQDPEVNFNWVQILTSYPGAAAEDVEREITAPLEESIGKVGDIKFVSSTSRESVSSILIRFHQIDDSTFRKRVADLRREVLNKYNAELPPGAREPELFEIVSSNAFPAAMVALTGPADDETLRKTAENLRKDLERLSGVDHVEGVGIAKPELHVRVDPEKLAARGISLVAIADSVRAYFRDVAAGSLNLNDQEWLVRFTGRQPDPGYLAGLPVVGLAGNVPLGEVASLERGTERETQLVMVDGHPAKLLHIYKKGGANTLKLIEQITAFVASHKSQLAQQGIGIRLVDDQSVRTRQSLSVMEGNALYGLALVLLITWVFLGWRLALLVTACIPFILCGVFFFLYVAGFTLNTTVLLSIVIVLGMLVDDSVVIAEAIYFRMQQGRSVMASALKGIRELAMPVLSSSLTTMAAFLPLALLPGILGDFMRAIPIVVTVALAISLIEAFWLLPAHALMFKLQFTEASKIHALRLKASNWLIGRYYRALLLSLKHPVISGTVAIFLLVGAGLLVLTGKVRSEFFADDPVRLFYVNVEMGPGSSVDATLDAVRRTEQVVRKRIPLDEVRSIVALAGYQVTEKEPSFGGHIGQLMVSLLPVPEGGQSVDDIIARLRPALASVPGPVRISFLKRSSGPPVGKPVEVKLRGDDYGELRSAADTLIAVLKRVPAVQNISDDDVPGKMELRLRADSDAIQRTGLNPVDVTRSLAILVDGEIVGQIHDEGEKLEVRVLAKHRSDADLDAILRQPLVLPDGAQTPLGSLVKVEKLQGKGNIRHYNFRRTITVQADLDKERMDTLQVNKLVQREWSKVENRYPGVTLDFSGELDDIKQSMQSLALLLVVGVGLIYIILGAQFRSYVQPLIILFTIPLAFAGVVFGLFISGNPISLYTLYGVVALTGIAVNSAIVLIDAANQRVAAGMDPLQAILYGARRRLLAILITSTTTIGGLVSLAAGWGGHSLLWSPMATAIVWGLAVSTLLTLFVVPLLYWVTSFHKTPVPSGTGNS